ncbi:hypothetical protein [Stutzerimonas nitrititolerans]|uniref:hypothetical protein n=1 Tax=Stutzerimonas nitrititolerans TaxID=2482751 RepID=UPI0028AF774A|nr:hypothetical protein [Stutzerimonas nitrititolerans]
MNKPIHPAVAEHVMQENEKLRGLLGKCVIRFRDYLNDDFDEEDVSAIEGLMHAASVALSQQAEPVEPVPAQDEREAVSRDAELYGIGFMVDGVCVHPSRVTVQYSAARPAQTEQQPVAYQYRCVETPSGRILFNEYYDGWHVCSRDYFESLKKTPKRGDCIYTGRELYAAPVAQTEQQPYGWHWQAIFLGETVNSGFEVGPSRPNIAKSVKGVTFKYQDVYAAPLAQAELVEALTKHRIALIPEYEGQWHADLYGDEGHTLFRAEGETPEEAVKSVIAALAAQGGE